MVAGWADEVGEVGLGVSVEAVWVWCELGCELGVTSER